MLATALIAVLAAPPAHPDSWMPFTNQRFVAANGRDYVVAWWRKKDPKQKKDWPRVLRIEIARAAKGAENVPVAKSDFKTHATIPAGIGVRRGDTLTAQFDLDQAPIEVLFDANGVTFFECHGSVGLGAWSALSLKWDGTERFRMKLDDFRFTQKEKASFGRTVSSIWWYDKVWIDHAEHALVVAGKNGAMRSVDLRDGDVTPVGPEAYGRFLADHHDAYAWMHQTETYADAMIADAPAMVASAAAPPLARILAASKAGRLGMHSGAEYVAKLATAEADCDATTRALAIRTLPYAAEPSDAAAAMRTVFAQRKDLDALSRRALARALYLARQDLETEVAIFAREGERFALPALLACARENTEGAAARAIPTMLKVTTAREFESIAGIVVFLTQAKIDGALPQLERLAKELAALDPNFAGEESTGFGGGKRLVSQRYIESTQNAIGHQRR